MKTSFRCFSASVGVLLSLSAGALAQTTWTNGADDSSWTNPGNWSAGVPSASSAVTINVQPTDDGIALDGGAPATIASLVFGASLTGSVEIAPVTPGDTLTINGGITNLTPTFSHEFSTVVTAGADAIFNGGTGGLSFNSLLIGTSEIQTLGSISIAGGGTLVFTLNSLADYGKIGAVNVTGAKISFATGPSFTASYGDVYDFTSGSFSGALASSVDPGNLPALEGSLYWDTTQFFSNGTLTVVPEPSVWSLVGASILGLALVRLHPRRSLQPALARIRIRR